MTPMNTVQLGQSDLHVTPICLGTMTFGEQVSEADAHAILDRSLVRGVNQHFLVYRNYHALIDYNCSNSYAISAGVLSDKVH